MSHLGLPPFLTWYTKIFLTRIRYQSMGNPNGGLLFNSAMPGSQGGHVKFPASCAYGNSTVYLADDVFVTRVEWRKRAVFPFHEFLVCYVSERRTSDNKYPRVSVIAIDRCVGKPQEPDHTSDQTPAQTLDETPDQALPPVPKANPTYLWSSLFRFKSKEPLMTFTQDGVPTLTPYVPPFPKAIPTFLRSSSRHFTSSPVSEDKMHFSLDGSDTFVYTEDQMDQYVCRTLNIQGESLSVFQLAVLACTVHDYYESNDFWYYQCSWFADTIYNTIKILVDKSASTLQGLHGKPSAYKEVDCRPHVPPGSFRRLSNEVMTGNPETHAAVYERFKVDLDLFKAEQKMKNVRRSLKQATQEELTRVRQAEDEIRKLNEEKERLKEEKERLFMSMQSAPSLSTHPQSATRF